MKSWRVVFLVGAPLVALLAAILVPATAQQEIDPKKKQAELRKDAMKKVIEKAQEEYRVFFKEPKTVPEYWAAMKFEMQTGKFDVAAYHLDKMMTQILTKSKDVEKDKLLEVEENKQLLDIAELEGLNTFLSLKTINEWSKHPELEKEARKNVEALIDQSMLVVELYLGDLNRLKQFIDSLTDKTPEIRNFAFVQVLRAKHRATPELVEQLRRGNNRDVIKNTMFKLDDDIIPPLLEALIARDKADADDKEFRLALLDILKRRPDPKKRVVPYLWYLSEAPQYPAMLERAKRPNIDPREFHFDPDGMGIWVSRRWLGHDEGELGNPFRRRK